MYLTFMFLVLPNYIMPLFQFWLWLNTKVSIWFHWRQKPLLSIIIELFPAVSTELIYIFFNIEILCLVN